MGIWLAIAGKDLRLLARDRAGLFFTVAFPVLFALFFGAVFGPGDSSSPRSLELRLVDQDRTSASREFLDSLAARPGVAARFDSLAGAEAAVRRGRASAALIVPKGFGERAARVFGPRPPEVELVVDPSRGAESGLLGGVLMELGFRRLEKSISRPASLLPEVRDWRRELAARADPAGQPLQRWTGELERFLEHLSRPDSSQARPAGAGSPLAGFEPLKIRTRELVAERQGPQSPFEISFPQGLVWGLISVSAAFGLSLVAERQAGTLRRLRAAPLERWHILGGKALACAASVVLLIAGMLLIGLPFGVRAERPALLLAVLPAVAAAFTGLMLLVSVLGKTERAASGIGWGLMTVLAMLGGGMLPLMLMPDWMRTLSHISPVKWAVLALEGALWRGFGWGELLPACAVLVGFGLLCGAIGVRLFQWRDA